MGQNFDFKILILISSNINKYHKLQKKKMIKLKNTIKENIFLHCIFRMIKFLVLKKLLKIKCKYKG